MNRGSKWPTVFTDKALYTLGFTVELPMGNGSTFGVDYSYTDTDPFKGSHAIGCRIDL